MRQCKIHIENLPGSPYSQSAKHDTPFLDREGHDAYEKRTWKEKCTVNKEGQVCIPAMAFKQCWDTTAYKLGIKIPGRRGATFKSFFTSGFLVDGDVPISNGKPITKDTVYSLSINANADGVRGSGKRVPRLFPQVDKWHGVVSCTIVDDVITQDIFEQHAKAGGMIVGVGRFRPEKGGTNGRFRITKFEWKEMQL